MSATASTSAILCARTRGRTWVRTRTRCGSNIRLARAGTSRPPTGTPRPAALTSSGVAITRQGALMRVRHQLFAMLGTAVGMLLAEGAFQRAEACSFPAPLVTVTSPAPGESNVPTNVVIDIVVFADPMPADILNQFTLVQMPSGLPVSTDRTRVDSNTAPYMTTVRLMTIAYLDPNRIYEIRQGTLPLATFSTGSLPDTTAPSPPTGASATVNTFDSHPDGGSDCITDRIRLVHLNVPTPSKPVVYTIKEGAMVITSFDSNLTGSFYCSGQPHWQGEPSWVISP